MSQLRPAWQVMEDVHNSLAELQEILDEDRINCFSYKDCEIMGDEDVVLWFVEGIPERWYPTKIVAEQAARITFPHEPNNAYGRVYFRRFFEE